MTLVVAGTLAIVNSTLANLTMTSRSPLITVSKGNQRI